MPVTKEHCELCLLQYLGANVNKAAMSTVRLAAKWSASSLQSRSNWTAMSSIRWAKHPLEHSHIIILDAVQWTGTCFRWQISKSKFVSIEKRWLHATENKCYFRGRKDQLPSPANAPLLDWRAAASISLFVLANCESQCYIVDFVVVALIGIRFITGKDKHLHLCVIVYPIEDGDIYVIKPLERATGSIHYRYLACNHQSVR